MIMTFFNPSPKGRTTQAHDTMSPEHLTANAAPSIGVTPPQILAQQAAAGRRGAAWRLLQLLAEDDTRAAVAIASLDDDRLARNLLEFTALGTWAGQPFVIPEPLRSPFARMRLRVLFLPCGGFDSVRAERVLTTALLDSRSALRVAAASILGLLGCATATPALIGALHDPVPSVQRESVKALGRTGTAAAVPALFSLLQHADEQLAGQIFSSLVRLGPAAVPALIETSASNSQWIRWHCIRALGEIRDIRALSPLVRALADTDRAVAWMAAKGLVSFGRLGVGPVLRLLISAPVTPWLVETASYVLSNQRNPGLKQYLAPVLEHMHGIEFQVGTILYAHKALSHLIADGLIEEGSLVGGQLKTN